MRKFALTLLCGTLTVSLLWAAESAQAIPAFKKEFDAKYVKKDGDDTQKAFAAKVEKVKCNVCHKGMKKKDRNAYGEALAELLDKKDDEKNLEKIREALEKVAAMHSVKGDDASPTFGDLISKGDLPGGEE